METLANAVSLGTEASFTAGLSSVLRVKESACTLVLLRDGQEVLRQPLRLDPGRRTTMRP